MSATAIQLEIAPPHRSGKPKGRHPEKRLTAAFVRNAKPGRHADGNGLYLVVDETGAKRWVLRVVVHGRRRDIGLGGASVVALAEAREQARILRGAARNGADPVAVRDKDKRCSPTFEEGARRFHAEQVVPNATNGKHVGQWIRTLETYAFPTIGAKPLHTVEQADILRILAPIWTETDETGRRVLQRLRTVLDWARTAGYRDGVNPCEGVKKGLARQKRHTEHFAALPWRDLPEVWRALDTRKGMGVLALRFAILTAARTKEVRGATWGEIDLADRVWTVPAERMKGRKVHRVPLSEPALAILNELRVGAPAANSIIFSVSAGRPLSENTLLAVLKRMGVAVTTHGFRSTLRDWTEEATAYPYEVKEAALAHKPKSKTERAYRRTDYLDQRRSMMDVWAAFVCSGEAAAGTEASPASAEQITKT